MSICLSCAAPKGRSLMMAAALSGSLLTIPASSANAQQLTFVPGALPQEQLSPNAAYGSVRFKLELLRNNRPTTRSIFEALMTGLGVLLKKEGHYTLSLEVLGPGGEVLGQRGIVSAQRRSSGWFIFNRIVKEEQTVEWFGDLVRGVLLRGDTNNIRLRVRSYYSKDVKFDLQTFNLLADLLTQTRLLGAANTALVATWKPLAQQIEGLFGSYEQSDVSDIVTLSFGRFESTPNPSSGAFIREYRVPSEGDAPSEKYTVKLVVETERSTSRVAKLVAGQVEGTISYGDVLAAARIGDQPVDLVLSTSNSEPVKNFIGDLNSTAGYKGEDIGERCDRTSEELARHFTVTDKVISYWALMHLYRRKIAANPNARDCITKPVRQQMTALGLTLADLSFAKDVEVASGGDKKGRVLETLSDTAPAIVEKVVPSNEAVDRLLGERGTSKTFQVFEIREPVD